LKFKLSLFWLFVGNSMLSCCTVGLIGSRDSLHILKSIMGKVNEALHCRDSMPPYLGKSWLNIWLKLVQHVQILDWQLAH